MSEKNDNKVPNVPNLRFSSFSDEWTTTLLKDSASFYKGTAISKEELSEDGHPCILYGELYTTYKTEKIEDVKSKTSLPAEKLVKSKANDVIIPASGETPIDIATACCIMNDDILLGGDLNIIRIKNHNGVFLSCQLNGKRKLDIAKIAQGASIVHLHNDDLKKLKCYFPRTLCEEEKIVAFLSKIDERIETQSKIISNLESLIKGIRQRIFSASNFNIHNSKEYELGSFLSEYSKKNIENNLISVSVGKYGIRRRDEIYSKELSDDYSKNKVIEKDSLIIGMGSTQIDIGILSKDEKYCVSPAYTTYKISGINSDYLREYLIHLNSLLSKRYMVIGARQGKSVNKSELMQHVLLVHNIEKQLQVVDIFNAFYDKLQKEKDILALYKKQKAYLLQNMFI